MAPFAVFGPDKNSWVIGNDVYILSHGLPPVISNPLTDGTTLLGEIAFGVLGPNNLQAWVRQNGSIYLTQNTNLLADVNRGDVDHIAFSPGGGWFIGYGDGRVRLSMEGKFSESFHRDAKKYMTTRGLGSYSLQFSTLAKVFFGAGETYIFQFRDGGALSWNDLPADLATELKAKAKDGWVITSRTCLSPHSKEHYYVEWIKNVAPNQYYTPDLRASRMYSFPPHSMLKPLFVRQVMEGEYPSEIPVDEEPIGSEPADSRLSVESLRDFCADVFEETDEKGVMTGEEFKLICLKLLPAEDMAKIWELTDLDHNGKYSLDEFILAWYLVLRRFSGKELPDELPMTTILKAKESNPNIARRTLLLQDSVKPICAGCKIIIGETGLSAAFLYYKDWSNPESSYALLCFACYCFKCPELAKTWRFKWTKLIKVKGEWADGALACSHCAKFLDKDEPHFECAEKCMFGVCKSCNKVGLRCPESHRLLPKYQDNAAPSKDISDVSSSFKSLNVSSAETTKSSIPSNPFTPSPSFKSSNPFSADTTPSSETSNPFQESSNQNKPTPKQEDTGKPADPSSLKEGEKQLREALEGQILKESPNVSWDDIAGLEAAKEELQEAVILPIKFPKLFSGKRKPRRGILLYGPPGTGKSYLAKAVATEAGYTLFSISSSDVTSKWLGESERLVKTLFKLARENKPSVIFIDELDALCGSRDAPGHNPLMQGLKTEFMVQMDGVGNDNDGILLLAATNLPWSLDPAIRRRFQRKLYIPLPDEEARVEMFKIHVGESMADLTDEDYAKLGKQTDGLSGSDISIAVQDALMQPVKKVSSSKHWRKVMDEGVEKLTPCKPTDAGALPMSWRKVPASKLLEPKVEVEDFFKVLEKIKPTVSEEEIKKCSDWTDQFGTEGA